MRKPRKSRKCRESRHFCTFPGKSFSVKHRISGTPFTNRIYFFLFALVEILSCQRLRIGMNISTLIVAYQLLNIHCKTEHRQAVLIELRDKIAEMLQVHCSAVQGALDRDFIPWQDFLNRVAEEQSIYLKHFWSALS